METLLVGRDSWGENIIYAATHTGLFAYDFANHRFLKTDLDLPRQPVAGKAVYWRGSIYYSAGGSLYKYTANPPSIELVGPDRDGGLPKDRRGDITNMVVSHNEILASIDPGTAGKATILGYNGDGWRVAWEAGTSGVPPTQCAQFSYTLKPTETSLSLSPNRQPPQSGRCPTKAPPSAIIRTSPIWCMVSASIFSSRLSYTSIISPPL